MRTVDENSLGDYASSLPRGLTFTVSCFNPPPQFDCCGSQNANDYAYTNSSFFCANEGPPASCLCDAGDDDCMQFNTTLICDGTQLNVTFYAWDEVGHMGGWVGRREGGRVGGWVGGRKGGKKEGYHLMY